jgi:hypothetical protein
MKKSNKKAPRKLKKMCDMSISNPTLPTSTDGKLPSLQSPTTGEGLSDHFGYPESPARQVECFSAK